MDRPFELGQPISWTTDADHLHGDEPIGMEGNEAAVETPSNEFTVIRSRWTCQDPACRAVMTTLTTMSIDMGLIDALVQTANAAAEGHVPPDHGWAIGEERDCPLCTSLDALGAFRAP